MPPPLRFTSHALREMLENLIVTTYLGMTVILLTLDLDLVLPAVLVKLKQIMIMLGLDLSVATEGRCPQQRVKNKVDFTMKSEIDLDQDLR